MKLSNHAPVRPLANGEIEVLIPVIFDRQDLDWIAKIPLEDDYPDSDSIYTLFRGILTGDAEGYDQDPDYDAFMHFTDAVVKIWQRIPALKKLAASA